MNSRAGSFQSVNNDKRKIFSYVRKQLSRFLFYPILREILIQRNLVTSFCRFYHRFCAKESSHGSSPATEVSQGPRWLQDRPLMENLCTSAVSSIMDPKQLARSVYHIILYYIIGRYAGNLYSRCNVNFNRDRRVFRKSCLKEKR